MKNTKYLIVFGMHRSGTSLISRMLNVFNAKHGLNLVEPKSDNIKGYFEDKELLNLNIEMLTSIKKRTVDLTYISSEDVNYLLEHFTDRAVKFLISKSNNEYVALKEPRMTKLLPFWHEIFRKCEINPFSFIAVRNPSSIVRSFMKRIPEKQQKTRSYYFLVWQSYMFPAIFFTSKYNRIFVRYEDLLDNPSSLIDQCSKKFSLSINHREKEIFISNFMDKSLQHNIDEDLEFFKDQEIPNSAKILYCNILSYTYKECFLDYAKLYCDCIKAERDST